MHRRQYLAASLGLGALGLPGCSSSNPTTGTEGTENTTTRDSTATETATETEDPDPASFEIVSVDAPDEVDVGEEHTFSITVENTGGQTGTFEETAEISVGSNPSWDEIGTITIEDIPPGETRTWESTSGVFDQAMTVQYRLGETEWQYEVVSVQPDIQIQQHDLVVEQGEYSTDVYVAATVINDGDAAASRISLTVNWFDEDGNYIDDSLGTCHALDVGETWAARVVFFTSEPDRVADYEISVDTVEGRPTTPAGVTLTDSRLLVGDNEAKVTGTVENSHSETLDYLEAAVKFYDADGVVLFTEYTNKTTVTAGETWDFEVETLLVDRLNQIESYEVVLSASIY